MRALSIAVALLAGCAFGAGPVIGLSKRGMTVGAQGGGGPGGRWAGVRGDVGLIVIPGDEGGAYLLAGGTGFILANPDSHYTGGAYAGVAGSYGGVFYDAGAIGVRWNRPPAEMECRGHGWSVSVGLRRLPDRVELTVWPQLLAYSYLDC